MLYCVFELGLHDLFIYSTDDEQDEDVKNKVWNNLQSFAFELGQILKNALCSINLKKHFFFFFLNVSQLYFCILFGGVAFIGQPVDSCGKSFQIFV